MRKYIFAKFKVFNKVLAGLSFEINQRILLRVEYVENKSPYRSTIYYSQMYTTLSTTPKLKRFPRIKTLPKISFFQQMKNVQTNYENKVI